ncbi:hypothetical protein SUZIE_198785 [Sciurus carolinensis]|uniref:Uncharacterized protein n=1 Tax=Sciurus carolinensis TaxID=30640 RepID=A0AA41NDZ2_SCICA|nr:hypothetical protein [Sciurus carolinensis]
MEGMDVDLDPELMQKFSWLGTTDKDVLNSEFHQLLGFQLNPAPAGCAFFLDIPTGTYKRQLAPITTLRALKSVCPPCPLVKMLP